MALTFLMCVDERSFEYFLTNGCRLFFGKFVEMAEKLPVLEMRPRPSLFSE